MPTPFTLLTTIKTTPFPSPSPFLMSFFQMGFPPKKDAIGRKSTSSEITEMSTDGGEEEGAADFWPVQRPIAPPPGDKPVECPFPNSNEWRFWRSSNRKGAEPMSKRRHSVSHDGDHYKRLLFPHKSHFHKF
ncbi:uncharacterized protein LOC131010586 [Salvia miltiorrhiza]|uniref:uncharacterized protein LOC131010586 n=1 Tax=Salvia miltiorrhiza TaxID=226208 RepID=UPI0025AC2B95|nr:uncharacterized protein LOC131010586 [Salvia miltiorrhiza]